MRGGHKENIGSESTDTNWRDAVVHASACQKSFAPSMDGCRRSKLPSVWVLNSERPNIESLSAVCCELGHHLLLLNPFSSVGSEDSSVCVAGVLIGGTDGNNWSPHWRSACSMVGGVQGKLGGLARVMKTKERFTSTSDEWQPHRVASESKTDLA